LPVAEQQAMDHAIEKLTVLGAQLPFPHASKVRGATALFELRPRAGRRAGVLSTGWCEYGHCSDRS
jgi:hypothetical protein